MASSEHVTISIDAGAGELVTGVVAFPREAPRPIGLVLGHGAGSDMNAAMLVAVADGLAGRGVTTLRFNFPYTERKRKLPDQKPALERCYRAAMVAMRERMPEGAAIVIGGKSMGGRIATMVAAEGEPTAGIILLGYPLHPPKQPERLRDAHLPKITAPMLFLTGTRDALCDLTLLRPVLAKLGRRATLHVVEGGDHSLDVLKSSGRSRADVLSEVLRTIDTWLARV
jgi:uncharacterized protein